MTAPTRVHGRTMHEWERMCLRKKRYPDQMLARIGALTVLESGQSSVPKLWVYRCPNCSGWHLTKNEWGGPNRRKALAPVTQDNLGY
jgi:hypothetical protein